MVERAYWIPLLPFIAWGCIAVGSRYLKNYSAALSILAILSSFVLSVGALLSRVGPGMESPPWSHSWSFLTVGGTTYPIGMQVDNLTAIMLIVVTLVAACVQIYSLGYMKGNEGIPRYFGFMSLFAAAMLGLVLADNWLLLFACWEGVGLTSYLLIGFWFRKPSASHAGKKAFLTTRTGDIGFLFGWILLFALTGSFQLSEARNAVLKDPHQPLFAVAALMIFWGAMGKSAQFPLHVWLPDAMEGPTPVSALIHAATMVAAGVYLVARTYFIFAASPVALTTVAYVGAFTALMAATIGMAMNDIKRVLAYSTVSQLGYMMAGLGAGGYAAGVFHLWTHAFFKSLLFLGSGSVIHAMGTNDMRRMGKLARYMPITYWTFIMATLALVGIPPFAGFFSKDEILSAAYKMGQEHGHWLVFVFLILGVFFTSFYMFRAIILTFLGKGRWETEPSAATARDAHDAGGHDSHGGHGGRRRPHESPPSMTLPLVLLAVLTLAAGFPLMGHFQRFVSIPYVAYEVEGYNIPVLSLSLLMAVLGILLAYQVYYYRRLDMYLLKRKFPLIELAVRKKYFFDELYNYAIIGPGMEFSRYCRAFDKWVIDGTVNAIGYLGVGVAFLCGAFDKYVVDGIINLLAWVTAALGHGVRRLQTGNVSNYFLIISGSITIILVLMELWMR